MRNGLVDFILSPATEWAQSSPENHALVPHFLIDFSVSITFLSLLPPHCVFPVAFKTIPVAFKNFSPLQVLFHSHTKLSPCGLKLCLPHRVTLYLSFPIVCEVVIQARVQLIGPGRWYKWMKPAQCTSVGNWRLGYALSQASDFHLTPANYSHGEVCIFLMWNFLKILWEPNKTILLVDSTFKSLFYTLIFLKLSL